MYCPFCHAKDTKVVDSRLILQGAQIRRRRECLRCAERFTTFESAELKMPTVIKRDGRREPFNVNNLRTGILRALEKRAVPTEQVEESLLGITQDIRRRGEQEIEAAQIGELAMIALYRLDHVAYVRFASVYKRFEDVSEFRETIEKMQDNIG